jgi:hypothetical protein
MCPGPLRPEPRRGCEAGVEAREMLVTGGGAAEVPGQLGVILALEVCSALENRQRRNALQ